MRKHFLLAQIMWKVGASHLALPRTIRSIDPIWKECIPEAVSDKEWWSPQVFYDNVVVPPNDAQTPQEIQCQTLECTLYPFQKRAVNWLLQREGAEFRNGKITTRPPIENSDGTLPPSFRAIERERGPKLYVSAVHGTVLTDEWALLDYKPNISGGILAEEMGLGKTVELIALICLHKRHNMPPAIHDAYSNSEVTPSGATLIATPQHILQQWMNELETHAPALKVLHYEGMGRSRKKDQVATVEHLLQYDVVITTYSVLAREIHYADTPPERDLRHKVKYVPRRSPLVLISWWRVCLDEAQMVESGVSNAATVARLIPRVNAWAVTGTPVKKSSEDLFGLLIFLRYEPFCNSRAIWNRVDLATFRQIFGAIALRHSKSAVRNELRLPPQKRIVITMPFSAIEEQHYIALFKQMCEDCGFTSDGSPASDEFDPDSTRLKEKMRNWLRRLRQTCLHPQIGSRNRRALGRGTGPLRTVAEVLEVMIDQNETVLRAEEKTFLLCVVLRGHIVAFGKNDPLRNIKSLELYQEALSTSETIVAECRTELETVVQAEANKRKLLKDSVDEEGDEKKNDYENEDGDEDDDTRSKKSRLSAIRKMLRSALETQHVCIFFVASAYFNLKEEQEEDSAEYKRFEALELKHYEVAKAIRKELLQAAHAKAQHVLNQISGKRKSEDNFSISVIPELDDYGGIESRKSLESWDMVSERLNEMAKYICEWRDEVVKRLLKPLVDEDEELETTGEEYEDSTKVQDELFVYITALRAIIADRNVILTGQANYRTDHEVKEAVRYAKEGEGHSPELLLKMLAIRNKLKPTFEDPSLKGVVSQLRAMATDLQWRSQQPSDRAGMELAIVEDHMREVQRISLVQTKTLNDLEKEQEMFHSAMNLRVFFYKQLQEISDTVAPYKEEMDEVFDKAAYSKVELKEKVHAGKLAQFKTKRRFLLHLREESEDQKETRTCIICTEAFETGVLTVCGHQFCKDCIRMWYAEHRTCPVCKRRLHLVDFHEVSYRKRELEAAEEHAQSSDSSKDREAGEDSAASPSSPSSETGSTVAPSTAIYSNIGVKEMNEIKSIDLEGSYGTKIDTIAKHILWLREHDAGSKSIIFSQYSDFLEVLSGAFDHFKIGNTAMGKTNGIDKFRRDAGIECFLLDAKSDSSGLNLVNATHVFLCEPLINTAIELQAIARVHRIGQQRPTTVYMYLVGDTVEEAIYEISVKRRLDHMSRSKKKEDGSRNTSASTSRLPSGCNTPAPGGLQEAALESANSLEIQAAQLAKLVVKGQGGGEVVSDGDLWNCLFRKPRASGNTAGGTVPSEIRGDYDRQVRAAAAEGRRMAQLVGAEDSGELSLRPHAT